MELGVELELGNRCPRAANFSHNNSAQCSVLSVRVVVFFKPL